MFTGIITHTAKLTSAKKSGGGIIMRFIRPWGVDIKKGDSINIDGICSTVRSLSARQFEVEYMPETIAKTTAGDWKEGRMVNIELSLRAADRLSGHIVQGHVDFTAKIINYAASGMWHRARFALPAAHRNFIVDKGSVAIDGVSLTISGIRKDWFEISLIEYTRSHTNLNGLKKGDRVNIETDIVGKYIVGMSKKPD
jgi:riboflavin synthase